MVLEPHYKDSQKRTALLGTVDQTINPALLIQNVLCISGSEKYTIVGPLQSILNEPHVNETAKYEENGGKRNSTEGEESTCNWVETETVYLDEMNYYVDILAHCATDDADFQARLRDVKRRILRLELDFRLYSYQEDIFQILKNNLLRNCQFLSQLASEHNQRKRDYSRRRVQVQHIQHMMFFDRVDYFI